MFSLLVLNEVNADPTDDRYGEGVNLAGGGDPDYADLDVGSVLLALSDGSIVQRGAAGADIADSIDRLKGLTAKFVVNTVNGLQKGLDINPEDMDYSYIAHINPVAQVMTVAVVAPADLTPFIGQYASLTITDVSMPEYDLKRTKNYTVVLTDANAGDIDTVMAELTALVNADHHGAVTGVYNAGTNTLTLTGVAGKRFNVVAEDVIRDSTIATTTQPVLGTPTTSLEKAQLELASWDGYNISKMASELYNLKSNVDTTMTYSVFVITTTNNTGPSKGHQFRNTQIIAVPSTCTDLILELTALLDYISGADAAATWVA